MKDRSDYPSHHWILNSALIQDIKEDAYSDTIFLNNNLLSCIDSLTKLNMIKMSEGIIDVFRELLDVILNPLMVAATKI